MSDTSPSAAPPPPSLPEPGAWRISARTAAILLVFTIVFTALMAGAYRLTRPAIEATRQEAKLRLVAEVLSPHEYDNDLLADAVILPPTPELGLAAPSTLYRARRADKPVALVFEAAAPDGYAGQIGLLLAVRADGRLAALRVTNHKETPGLGDYIDLKKDKNKSAPWIAQFDEREFADATRWRVKKDGGAFDQRAGATISARAVVNSSGRAVQWLLPRAAALYALPAGARYEDQTP